MHESMSKAVRAYLALRDQKDALRKQQAAEMAPITDKMERLEAWFLNQLQESGVESAKTAGGTAYQTIRTSATVNDWDALLTHIVENELWELLERRVNKTTVEEIIEAAGEPPPGVAIRRERRVNVRR